MSTTYSNNLSKFILYFRNSTRTDKPLLTVLVWAVLLAVLQEELIGAPILKFNIGEAFNAEYQCHCIF